MNKILFVTLILISIQGIGVCQENTFSFLLDTQNDLYISDAIETSNHSYFFVGFSRKSRDFDNNRKGFILKISNSGVLTDSISYSFHRRNDIKNILYDENNIFLISGSYTDDTDFNNYYRSRILHRKIDTNFNIIQIDSSKLPEEYTLWNCFTRRGYNNEILSVGYMVKYIPYLKLHGFVYKFSENLDSLLFKIPTDASYLMNDIKQLNDSTYWVITELFGKYLELDSNFNLINDNFRTPNRINASYGIKWDTDTSFYLAGDYISSNGESKTSDHDIGFFKQFHPFDTSGYYINFFGTPDTLDFPAYYDALDYKNKDTIYIGATKNLQYGNIDYGTIPSWFTIIQVDSMLDIRWEHFYGGDAYYAMTKVLATEDGGCIVAGTRFDFINNIVEERDIYILKVNNEGLLTSVDGKKAGIVHDAIVYPNPGSGFVNIQVAAQHKNAVFRLFDINGRKVFEKDITRRISKVYTTFLENGTYIYTITNNKGLSETGKWIKQ